MVSQGRRPGTHRIQTPTGSYFRKIDLSTLRNLLRNPKFADIAREYVQFKNFRFSRELPQDWGYYLSEDKQGNQESFMQEVLSAKDIDLKNISQYIEDNKGMAALKNRIIKAADEFDNNWGRECRRLKN